MASEIHTIIPQNINLVSETLVYDILSKNGNLHGQYLNDFINYGDSQEYPPYNGSGDSYEYIDSNRSSPEVMKMPFNLIPPTHYKVVNYENNTKTKDADHRRYVKNSENCRTNSPKGYESDESSTSYSSRGSPDNGTKNKEKAANNQNEFYSRPGVFQPNLYQPNVNYNRNSRYYHGGNRNSNSATLVERKVHGLMKRFQARIYKLRIDTNPLDLMNGGPWDQLNQEIWDVFKSKAQREETYMNKINLWKSVFLFLRTSLSNYGLYLVGSTMSGFGLEGSDIDLCILTKPFINEPRIDSVHQLNRLKHLLLKNGLASEAELIMAKVPILKFKNKETGFEVDLNCNNAVGIQNTHMLYCYAQLDWRVRPLVVMVKVWAQANHINEAKNMTISSYSWALMVIHYLQWNFVAVGIVKLSRLCIHQNKPFRRPPQNVSTGIRRFKDVFSTLRSDKCTQLEIVKLQFEVTNVTSLKNFGGVKPPVLPCLHDMFPEKFNSYEHHSMDVHEEIEALKEYESDNTRCLGDLLIVRTGSQLPIETCKHMKSPKNDPNQWKCLCIEEPFDFSNTARSVFDLGVFKHIKHIIISSYKELARNKTLSHILPVNLKR